MGYQQPEPAAQPVAVCTDSSRARELYKYFQPPNTVSVARSATPDTVLTAHCQLIAWRLDIQRAIISLIDRETQYFVAESTKTLDLANCDESEDPDDAVWAVCKSVPKRGRLCEQTLEQTPSSDGTPACFEVTDLSKDAQYSSLPFVAGEPHFRYYVGVPLRTKKGIAIGSLFAMDVKPREPLSPSARKFLTIMASNVMEHLELMKEKEDRKRAVNMNMCLAAFVDPEHPLRKRKRPVNHHRNRSLKHTTFAEYKTARSVKGEEHSESIASPKLPGTPKSTRSSRRSIGSRNADPANSSDESETETSSRVCDNDHPETFERASKGLMDSLSLKGGGGVVFMSTTAGLRPEGAPHHSVNPSVDDLKESAAQHRVSFGSHLTDHSMDNAPSYGDSSHSVDILAHTASAAIHEDDQDGNPEEFTPLSPEDLAKLIRRHPRGKLYSFGDDGLSQGSSGEESLTTEYSPTSTGTRRRLPSRSEAVIIARHFPGARQVIFVPLWDVQIESWVACFVYNTSDFRTFGHNPDFLHCIAFCSCVMTEVARLATMASDQQKSDFIGSISHELRSPLHGILASCEFLEDTECSSYQKSLVSTADSCARTLLDTINMVLDYSKINSFERNIRKARKSRKDGGAQNALHPIMQQPTLNIYDAVDLAAITEEVVAGVALGHVFRDITTFENADDKLQGAPNRNLGTLDDGVSQKATRPAVEIIMNIEARRWDFITQPGAVRRIVMNLFGNAIKYTRNGFIRVSLSAKDIKDAPSQNTNGTQDLPATSIVTLTISDSGQGISPEYLRTKLFTPFAQENPINPGTGLGLSLVRSIVDMLNGEINIRSALGVGTDVVVTLPMVKGGGGSSSTNSTTTPASVPASSAGTATTGSSGTNRPIQSCLNSVRLAASGMTAAMFRPPDYEKLTSPLTTRALELEKASLECFLKDWYGFSDVFNWCPETRPDLITVDEVDLPYLLELCPRLRGNLSSGPMLLVIRAGTGKCSATDELMKHVNLEYLPRPVGPYKLAKALQNVMDKRAKKISPSSIADSVVSPETAEDIFVDEVVTRVEQITLKTNHNGAPETLSVLHQGDILGNDESMNAHMAMDTLPSPNAIPPVELNGEFPFPDPAPAPPRGDGTTSPPFAPPPHEERPPFEHSRTMSWTPQERLQNEAPPASPMSSQGVAVTSNDNKNHLSDLVRKPSLAPSPFADPATVPTIVNRPSSVDTAGTVTPNRHKSVSSRRSSKTPTPGHNGARTPRLLLVDDNAVNLRLLQTFMRKRAYTAVHSAADGAEAVAVFESLLFGNDTNTNTNGQNGDHKYQHIPAPPDIIFMDISMPIMNGFEATRRIRALEAEFAAQCSSQPHLRPPPSLIVALTGLASGRDQSEAFTSGFDLYMTKPVSFREVGRLLDNWVANGGVGEGRDGGTVVVVQEDEVKAVGMVAGQGQVGMGRKASVPFGPVVGEVL